MLRKTESAIAHITTEMQFKVVFDQVTPFFLKKPKFKRRQHQIH